MVWRRLVLGAFVVLAIFLLIRLFVSEQGYFAYKERKMEFLALQEKIIQLQERNLSLSREIRLLNEDKEYMEKVIRQRMNFVKEDEVLYIFSENSSADAGEPTEFPPVKPASGAIQDEGKN